MTRLPAYTLGLVLAFGAITACGDDPEIVSATDGPATTTPTVGGPTEQVIADGQHTAGSPASTAA